MYSLEQFLEFIVLEIYHFFLKAQRLHFGRFRVSFTQDAQSYFEIFWLLLLKLQVCLQFYQLLNFIRCKLPKHALVFMWHIVTKKKCRKDVLVSTFLPLLLNCFDLPSYDSELRKRHTKTVVHVSKGWDWQGVGFESGSTRRGEQMI